MFKSSIANPEPSTRERLIAAAGAVFARDGFQRAGVRDICGLAGANVASVKYYFGNKEGLYRETILQGVKELGAGPSLAPQGDFEAFLKLAPNAPERAAVESIMRTVRGR